ncbi:hypothetical protein HanIR_Chr07g0333871 [Helianthus annuus]|nr:hypothetical protein HanIR_Chr07g0333871 [Helianthus annuus]
MWCFTLIKYFLTTVLMKISAAKLDNNQIPPELAMAARSRVLYQEGTGVVKIISRLNYTPKTSYKEKCLSTFR